MAENVADLMVTSKPPLSHFTVGKLHIEVGRARRARDAKKHCHSWSLRAEAHMPIAVRAESVATAPLIIARISFSRAAIFIQ